MNYIAYTDEDCRRFWNKVSKGDGCWEFGGNSFSRGYGLFRIRNKATTAHRFAWIMEHGQIENGLYVCHRCDNPKCVRSTCAMPGCDHGMFARACESHLFLGTNDDNQLDRKIKNAKSFQPLKYSRPRASFTDEELAEARYLIWLGLTEGTVAAILNCSQGYIHAKTGDIDNGFRRGAHNRRLMSPELRARKEMERREAARRPPRLTAEEEEDIRQRIRDGETLKAVGKRYGLSGASIHYRVHAMTDRRKYHPRKASRSAK